MAARPITVAAIVARVVLVIGARALPSPEKVGDILVRLGVRPRVVEALLKVATTATVLQHAPRAQVARPMVGARAGGQAIGVVGEDPANGVPRRRVGPATAPPTTTGRQAVPARPKDMEVAPAREFLALDAATARGRVVPSTVGGRRRGPVKVESRVGGAALHQAVETVHRSANGSARVGRQPLYVAPSIQYLVLGLKSLLLELMELGLLELWVAVKAVGWFRRMALRLGLALALVLRLGLASVLALALRRLRGLCRSCRLLRLWLRRLRRLRRRPSLWRRRLRPRLRGWRSWLRRLASGRLALQPRLWRRW